MLIKEYKNKLASVKGRMEIFDKNFEQFEQF